MTRVRKASELLVQCLEVEGVRTIYGVPGEENADLMIALEDSSIEFVICHQEQGAAFMAEVQGRLTGKPGVCLGTLGPGATNLVTGVANGNFDHAPLVAITGQASTHRLHKESHQNMDVLSMFRPITKWNTTIHSAENIPEVVRKAFLRAAAEKPGATHVELPEDIAARTTAQEPLPLRPRARRPSPDPKAVEEACRLIEQASSPVILAGNGCIRKRASARLRELAESTGIHVANTFMGKGALSADSELCLYSAGLGSRDHVSEAFETADLVLCVGYDMIEWPPDHWNTGRQKRIVHIDFEEAEADEFYQADVQIMGDVAAALAAIHERLGKRPSRPNPLYSHLREHIARELREWDADNSFPMKPQRILSEVRRVLAPEDILVSDVGAHKMWVARHYPVYAPGTCIISNGFCSMGIALPGAIAAKRTHPERKVVGLMGDGGFLMNVQELATAVQYRVPAIFMIWEDGGYGLIRWKQEARFGRSASTDFKNPDLVRLAESFGCASARVNRAEELAPVLRRALAETERPAVIVVPVDYRENMKLTKRLGELISH